MSNVARVQKRCHHPGPRVCAAESATESDVPKIFIIDDEYFAREEIRAVLSAGAWEVEAYDSAEAFLGAYRQRDATCLVLDVHLPGMSGLELLDRLAHAADAPPVIIVSGSSGVAEAVRSLKAGAADFIQKPVVGDSLIASVRAALSRSQSLRAIRAAVSQLGDLTVRQQQILDQVLAGSPSKNIAADLGISRRTVESHRAAIMQRTGATSLPDLTRLVMCNNCPLVA